MLVIKKEQSWLAFVNQEYLHYFLTNLVSSLAFGYIVFTGISMVFLITVPVISACLPSLLSVFSCNIVTRDVFFIIFFLIEGKRGQFAITEMSSLFPWL